MGNVEMHDLAPVRDDERKELNISRKVNYRQYCKHLKGENAEACLLELPWSIRDSVSLYERMDASFNCLEDVPVELPLRLPHLSYINLGYNRILTLPESFGLFFHLRTVILNNNRLKTLPESFLHLVKLEKLDLCHNVMRELPEELGKMESLKQLNVSHNKLKTLPLTLGGSLTISVILARGNRMITPPQAVCNEGSAAILEFLRTKYKQGDSLLEIKSKGNEFPRERGNHLITSVPNPQSAQAQYIQAQTNTTNTPSRIKTPLMPPLGATSLDAIDLRNRITGMLYGAAIGDAIGIATTHMTPDESNFHYNLESISYTDIIRDEHRVHWRQGDWTSDFDHMVLVLESLTRWGGVVDELDFASQLCSWHKTGFKDLGDTEGYITSNTIVKCVNNPNFSKTPHVVSRELLEGRSESQRDTTYVDNGALVRSLVLGIPHFYDLEEVTSNAARICRATHSDPRCIATSITSAILVALLLQGDLDVQHPEVIEELLNKAKGYGVQWLTEKSHIEAFDEAMSSTDLQSINVGEVGKEDHVFTTLAVMVTALRMNLTYRQIITNVMVLGGCSNTNACVTGAVIGCYQGYSKLPVQWLEGLRKRQTDWLNIKINHLLDMMAIP